MDAVLRVAGDEQVHVVGHRFKLDDRRIFLSADLWHDLLEAFVNSTRDDGPAVLRAPDNMEGAAVYDVVVRSGLVFLGASRVTARRYLEFLADSALVARRSRYGGPGRPEVEYHWVDR